MVFKLIHDPQHTLGLATTLDAHSLPHHCGSAKPANTSLSHRYLENSHFQWARKFFRPAEYIRRRAELAAAEIRSVYDTQYYFAMHYRQGDFNQACPGWGDAIDGLACMIPSDVAISTLHKVLQVPEQTVLFIVPPQPEESLGQLCKVYRCTHRELLPAYKQATEGLPDMMLSQHNFAVAMESARAFGNMYSSWSVELIATMRMAGKPADMMNRPPCNQCNS